MKDAEIREHLDAALAGIAEHDHHVRGDLALPVFRAAIALLSSIREPDVSRLMMGIGDQDRAIKDLEKKLREEERNRLIKLLDNEANRVFNKQKPEYPSNVLDVVSSNLRAGQETDLTVMPRWMCLQRGIEPKEENR